MTIDNGIAAAGFTALLSVQGWALLQIVNLKVSMARLGQRVNDWPEPCKIHRTKTGTALALIILAFGLSVVLCGCSSGLRAKGGSIKHSPGVGIVTQPENAKDGAEQKSEAQHNIEVPIPAGSEIKFQRVEGGVTNLVTVKLSEPSTYRDLSTENRQSKVGGSQVDTVGAIVAKLKAARWMTILGALLCVGGLACAFVPYLSAILGGMTPGLAMSGGGLVIAGLPYIIIGNERLLIGGGLGAALLVIGGIFLYRHGGKTAALNLLKKVEGKPA